MDKYNGWTNYPTWRVNLEMIDGLDPREYWPDVRDAYDLGVSVREWAEEIICESAPEGLARDYALSFLSDVNWTEIAEHLLDDYPQEEEEEEEV